MITISELSAIMYSLDPMDTQCRVNKNMENEYDYEASCVMRLMRDGHTFEAALHFIFAYTFSRGCLVDNPVTPLIISDYYKLKRSVYKIDV